MKHSSFCARILLILGLCVASVAYAEQVQVVGDYTTAGTVNGDLVVTNGSISVAGDLTVQGDVKVTSGRVIMSGGDLNINGDLVVTNTKLDVVSANQDATITVTGDLRVRGAVITKSTYGHASIEAWDPTDGVKGSLYAGRVSTRGAVDGHICVDHNITVTGSIVTKGDQGYAYVRSNGLSSIYGDIYAGSIYTYSPDDSAYIHCENGHIIVNGPIMTKAFDDAFVYAEGNIEAGMLFTRSDEQDAYVSGEKVLVNGDIRTEALAGHAFVRARMTTLGGQEGTFEDIIANNIYTRGYTSAPVRAFRTIKVSGDIVTWETEAVGRYRESGEMAGAMVSAGDLAGRAPAYNAGWIEAANVLTRGVSDARVEASGSIDVPGDIIIKSDGYASVYTYSNDINVGNISIDGVSNSYVESALGNIYVDHVISTTNPDALIGRSIYRARTGLGRAGVLATVGSIEAEKIFTDGFDDSSVGNVSSGTVDVRGPIVTKSETGDAYVYSYGNLTAGAISTQAQDSGEVESATGSITVREDIRATSVIGDAFVHANTGDISARSIKTSAASGSDDSIRAAAGSADFQLVLNTADADNVLIIKDAKFDLDSDYEWNSVLSLMGTCTLDGKGHHINFGSSGGIVVTSGASLLLNNVILRNIGGTIIRCADNTGTFSLQDVVWTQTDDTQFQNGMMHIIGDLRITGTETVFSYESTANSMIHEDAVLTFDRGVTFSYDTNSATRLGMTDETSRLHFDGSILDAAQDCRLTNGTLVVDNIVTFSAEVGKTIRLGDGVLANNLDFEFGEASKLLLGGDVDSDNV